MKFLNTTGLTKLWDKIKSLFVQSEQIRKIVIVDEYPEVEEEGVLYLKKNGISSDGNTGELVNLYYQDNEKNGGSESSGYVYNFYTNNTFDIDSFGVALSSDKEKNSNSFSLSLTEGKTYKIKFKYISGNVTGTDGTLINVRLINYDTSNVLVSQSVKSLEDLEFTYTATATETINARIGFYAYSSRIYNALVYEIAIYEE